MSPEKDTLNKISIWMNGETVRYRNMAGHGAAVYFHLKHVQDLQKEKFWLINCSIEAFDEIDCQRVFELHSVEGHDGCFSTHYVYLRLDRGFLVQFQVHLSWWNAPQK